MAAQQDNLTFNTALVTGGGGGIGFAISKYLISLGKKVIIAGRTESKLQAAVEELGREQATYYVLDTGAIGSIPSFVQKLVAEHPDLDCVINNAGVQRPLRALEMEPSDFLAKGDQEIDINIRGPMHLTLHLLPHLRTKEKGAVVMNISSVLGYIPFSVINPVYNGTKAFQHMWSMNLRSQLQDTRIRVVEVAPPTVATDLHREREDPDDNKKENNPSALSVDEFMREFRLGMEHGRSTFGAGMGGQVVNRWFGEFGEQRLMIDPVRT
ncbi:NAD(P)-binding protein [Saccharata proteae CBS 121410]|uniref:NAD(P)-binding protein n=1 Tax=Saccharata proteae CBS 121410 TaxID=1314787 RepID=A0A9P4M1M9_9PEZI|nr:NAD(P)-binding protein [Saccharata proteae CBS 121410]